MKIKNKKIWEVDKNEIMVDVDSVVENIEKEKENEDEEGVKMRKKIKKKKLKFLERMKVKEGEVGIKWKKMGEEEVMEDEGMKDIFMKYNIMGKEKIDRINEMNRRIKI